MTEAHGLGGTRAVPKGHRLDAAAVDAWLHCNVRDYAGPLTIQQFTGGQSNPTYKLVTPVKSYVLRAKPPGLLLKGAHAVDREARVLLALFDAGFLVPHVHSLCTDDSIIGTWFYVMDMVDGRVFWDPALPDVARGERSAYFDAMNATIADLHTIIPDSIGLGDYGRPHNFVARQIARWSKQYLEDHEAGRDENMDRLVEWLPTHLPPEQDAAVVHGDFRIDNLMFHPTEPRVLAVLDWELSTLGDPLADFTYHLMMYRLPRLTIPGLAEIDLQANGIPEEEGYIRAYCRRTGRTEIPSLDFYLAFNLFRFAAICHGINGRLARGTATSANAATVVADFPIIAALGWQQAEATAASGRSPLL